MKRLVFVMLCFASLCCVLYAEDGAYISTYDFRNILNLNAITYSNGLNNGSLLDNTIIYDPDGPWSFIVTLRRDARSSWDTTQYYYGGAYQLNDTQQVQLQLMTGSDSTQAQANGYDLLFTQNLGEELYLFLGDRYLQYTANNINLISVGAQKYFSDYTHLIAKLFYSSDKFNVSSGVAWLQYTFGLTDRWQGIVGGTMGNSYDNEADLIAGNIHTYQSAYIGAAYHFVPLVNILSVSVESASEETYSPRTTWKLVWDYKFN